MHTDVCICALSQESVVLGCIPVVITCLAYIGPGFLPKQCRGRLGVVWMMRVETYWVSEKAVPSLSVLVRVSYLERARAVWTEEQQKPEIHEEMKGHLQLHLISDERILVFHLKCHQRGCQRNWATVSMFEELCKGHVLNILTLYTTWSML